MFIILYSERQSSKVFKPGFPLDPYLGSFGNDFVKLFTINPQMPEFNIGVCIIK